MTPIAIPPQEGKPAFPSKFQYQDTISQAIDEKDTQLQQINRVVGPSPLSESEIELIEVLDL
jgi:hypothetical protein